MSTYNYELYEECLSNEGYTEHFEKISARILYNTDEDGYIKEILVTNFENPEKNQHYYRKYQKDIGNCLSEWDKWSLSDVLLHLWCYYGINKTCRLKALLELSKITEFRKEVSPIIYRMSKYGG